MQLAGDKDNMIDPETSAYALFSLSNRKLCGVDLQKDFDNARLFVDMNPNNNVHDGWFCGFINDAATVNFQGGVEYYPKSRSAQNIEIIPFSIAPFQVGVTTKDVKKGEELFVSYGYNYWVNALIRQTDDAWIPKSATIEQHEREAEVEMYAAVNAADKKYEEESWVLSNIFDNMNSETPPSISSPKYTSAGRIRKRLNWIRSLATKLKRGA